MKEATVILLIWMTFFLIEILMLLRKTLKMIKKIKTNLRSNLTFNHVSAIFYFRPRSSHISEIPPLYGALYQSFQNQLAITSSVVNYDAPLDERNG